MLKLFYSNRYEVLAEALLDELAHGSPNPWQAESIIVPSSALRRRLELDFASRFGICANVHFTYLAQWLWQQAAQVLTLPEQSLYAKEQLVWRCYRLLDPLDERWMHDDRLGAYLRAADETMRYELAQRVAALFDQYLTYRPDWLATWQEGRSILPPLEGAQQAGQSILTANQTQRGDERWQAELWRFLSAETQTLQTLNEEPGLSMQRFLTELRARAIRATDTPPATSPWPQRVSVFALPTIAPLHLAVLRELANWVDVRLYLLNPCREYWYDIVRTARVAELALAQQIDYQEIGNSLLAEWGRQTQAQLHVLQEMTQDTAVIEAAKYVENPAPTWLAAVQNAILNLQAQPVPIQATAAGIEVHVCHSLSRQLEVLHDRLLALFNDKNENKNKGNPTLEPAEVLVAVPDLVAAAPLIDAVFGNILTGMSGPQRIPYRITGLPPSSINPIARALDSMLTLSEREVALTDLLEWLHVDALAARYGIEATALETVEIWLQTAGARRGFSPEPVAQGASPKRHTFADALMRLYLGYALPEGALPNGDWLPIAGAGGQAELLGRLSRLVDDLDEFAQACATARTAEGWQVLLSTALERFFGTQGHSAPQVAQITEVRQALSQLAEVIHMEAPDTLIPAAVIRRALSAALDDAAPGGVPSGGVTFTAFTSLRSLPYRVICLLGLEQGVLPSVARADEFDLIAAFGRSGDRQRRDDERNLFLDLLLAAREHFWVAYTGRSLRDNAPLPPAAPVDELLDYLAQAVADPGATPEALRAARQRFIIEHPLQSFSSDYFSSTAAGDNPLFTYDTNRAEIAAALALPASQRTQLPPFFAKPLTPHHESGLTFTNFVRFWRHPARALLRDRLGAALSYPASECADTEPFEFDWQARDALATRLLPILLAPDETAEAVSTERNNLSVDTLPTSLLERAARIAQACPELPGGALGEIWRKHELFALTQFAGRVRKAVINSAPYPFALSLTPLWPAALPLPDSRAALADVPVALNGTLPTVTAQGLVLYRYARPSARDYLEAWLHHLVLCTAAPAEIVPRTLWLGKTEVFTFTAVTDAASYLGQLIALYQAGLCHPLHFFPRSAWAAVTENEAVASRVWLGTPQTVGEAQDPYWRAALREPSGETVLDANFMAVARSVFGPLQAHLEVTEER